jgi:hypothetical protein
VNRATFARQLLPLVVGALAAWLVWMKSTWSGGGSMFGLPLTATDFDQLWFAARAVRSGRDPYPLVGPGREFEWPWPLLYPMPAVLAAMPFSFASLAGARSAFAGVSAWALCAAFLGARGGTGSHRVTAFLSLPAYNAAMAAQWPPALMAAAALQNGALRGALIGIGLCVKPHVALALLVTSTARRELRWAVAAAAGFCALSLAVAPWWPLAWLRALRTGAGDQRIAILVPGGAVLLLALLRWRRPEARLLTALAIVPQTFHWYDALPLWLVTRSAREGLALVALSRLAGFAVPFLFPAPDSLKSLFDQESHVIVWFLYLPCLVLVLRRPNATDPTSDRGITPPG